MVALGGSLTATASRASSAQRKRPAGDVDNTDPDGPPSAVALTGGLKPPITTCILSKEELLTHVQTLHEGATLARVNESIDDLLSILYNTCAQELKLPMLQHVHEWLQSAHEHHLMHLPQQLSDEQLSDDSIPDAPVSLDFQRAHRR